MYIPKVERRDLSVYRGSSVELRQKRAIPAETRATVARILDQTYDELSFQGLGHKDKEVELGLALRHGRQYSENNMGFGEGRVLYMVDLLERFPEQSLFFLEEPETSLHEDAQYRLAKYLITVCNQRHHQILMSTHSSVILDALPAECRKLLHRDEAGVSAFSGLSSTRARAILSAGHQRGLTICVEDEFSRLLLVEILRKVDAGLLKAVAIEPLGGKAAVVNGVRLLAKLGQKAIGVRDGDAGPDPPQNLYSLPGRNAPELEVFSCPHVVSAMKSEYGLDVSGFLSKNLDKEAHELPSLLAADIDLLKDALSTRAAQVYVQNLDPDSYGPMVEAIKAKA